MVVFKMRDSVPSARYSSVCNVLSKWSILLIPIYRVYRYIDFLILLIPTPLVSVIFCSSIPTFCSFLKMSYFLVPVLFCNNILCIKAFFHVV